MEEQESLIRARAHPVIVTLPSEIDMSNASSVGRRLQQAVEQGARVLVADLTATDFCDSSGLRNLLLAQSTAAAAGTDLRVVVRSGAVHRVMELIGLLDTLRVFPTLDAALAAEPHPGPP